MTGILHPARDNPIRVPIPTPITGFGRAGHVPVPEVAKEAATGRPLGEVDPKEQVGMDQARHEHLHDGVPSPLPLQLLQHWEWWRRHGSRRAKDILSKGLLPEVSLPRCVSSVLFLCPHPHDTVEHKFASELVRKYKSIGALVRCNRSDILYFVPWFIVLKTDHLPSGDVVTKGRFVVNLKRPKQSLPTQRFKLDHWQVVFPALRRGFWGGKG